MCNGDDEADRRIDGERRTQISRPKRKLNVMDVFHTNNWQETSDDMTGHMMLMSSAGSDDDKLWFRFGGFFISLILVIH